MSAGIGKDLGYDLGYELGADGIVVLTIDDPGATTNTMNPAFVSALTSAVDALYAEKERLTGVIVTSAKTTFFAGGDLAAIMALRPSDAAAVFAGVESVKAALRRLETIGVPVVAAINGSALGGGLEIALACHHRIVVDDASLELGLPEVTLGLLPGAGGITRTVAMFGLADALTKHLLQGQRRSPADALAAGLIEALVDDLADLLPAAREWVLNHRGDASAASQPWDRDGYWLPGGTPSTSALAAVLPAFPATLRKQLKGAPYPAPPAIMSAAVEGAQVDLETASRIESRYFTTLAIGQPAKNMTQAFFFDLQEIGKGARRPRGVAAFVPTRVAVLGAGMMGAGIAHACASAGLDVVLTDVDVAAAQRGKAHAERLTASRVDRGSLAPAARDELLGRITPTADANELAGCDLVIEAVFEDPDLKRRVLADVEASVSAEALLCTNTSTLPISGLATAVTRRADVIGLHFFSPVERMRLIEIVVGDETSDDAVARAYDVARLLGKTPIIVNDSRGFFTSRVFGTLVMEAAAMVSEHVSPVQIERAATLAGFPAAPLAMLDEVSLTLPQHIRDAARAAGDPASAGAFADHPGMDVVDVMVDELGRHGRTAAAGFYDYPDGEEKSLWPGLMARFDVSDEPLTDEGLRVLQDRLTFTMSLETVRCLEEGVLRSVAEANIGSIFGIGFPALYGGALQHINGYDGGLPGFVARACELAAVHGERFAPPPLLLEKAEAGQSF